MQSAVNGSDSVRAWRIHPIVQSAKSVPSVIEAASSYAHPVRFAEL